LRIFLLDVDNTIAPFQPTAELYKRLFLRKKNFKYFATGYFMIVLLKLFWYLPFVVELQRRLIMSFFANADPCQVEQESDRIAKEVVLAFNEDFSKVLSYYKTQNDQIYLLTHCPTLISKKIFANLGFDGEYSIEIRDYLKTKTRPVNMDKHKILMTIKKANPDTKIFYFADDLIDIKCLLAADEGILINASIFTKVVSMLFFRRIKIWN